MGRGHPEELIIDPGIVEGTVHVEPVTLKKIIPGHGFNHLGGVITGGLRGIKASRAVALEPRVKLHNQALPKNRGLFIVPVVKVSPADIVPDQQTKALLDLNATGIGMVEVQPFGLV